MSEVNETKPKKRNISIRVASSSTDLKRKFFENSMCALNLKTPGKLHKRSAPNFFDESHASQKAWPRAQWWTNVTFKWH